MKFFKKRILILITILIFVFSFGFIFHFTNKNSIESNGGILTASASALSFRGKVDSLLPVRFKIPQINIDAEIESVGLTKEGAVGTPVGPSNVAWFMNSPIPGEVGNSIIDGHSGWKGGKPAVFDNLYKIKIGDKVSVESNAGVTNTFVVKKISKFSPNADATNVFISTDGKSHLNLITCTGFWNNILKSHSSRLVVFTDKE